MATEFLSIKCKNVKKLYILVQSLSARILPSNWLFIHPCTWHCPVVGCKVEGRRRIAKINEHKSYHIAQEAKRLRLEEALGAPMDKHALPVPHTGNMGDQ